MLFGSQNNIHQREQEGPDGQTTNLLWVNKPSLKSCCLFLPQDYNSLFPLDDTQPSKLMRLLSSNEDEPVALSSPGQCIHVWV